MSNKFKRLNKHVKLIEKQNYGGSMKKGDWLAMLVVLIGMLLLGWAFVMYATKPEVMYAGDWDYDAKMKAHQEGREYKVEESE